MNRFSNINWAAFLLGSNWAMSNGFKAWSFLYLAAVTVVFASVYFLETFFIVVLGVYPALAFISIYLALQGNHMVVKAIQKEELSSEEENEERLIAAARQQKLLVSSVTSRPFYYLIFALVPGFFLVSGYHVTETPPSLFLLLFIMLAIDAVALMLVLVIAYVRGDTENELYSGEKIDVELIIATPMRYQSTPGG